MNIDNQINFSGVLDQDMDEATRSVVEGLVYRLESFRVALVNQLRSQPTVFAVNPDTDPEAVAGAKAGDLAFWTDSDGNDQFRIL